MLEHTHTLTLALLSLSDDKEEVDEEVEDSTAADLQDMTKESTAADEEAVTVVDEEVEHSTNSLSPDDPLVPRDWVMAGRGNIQISVDEAGEEEAMDHDAVESKSKGVSEIILPSRTQTHTHTCLSHTCSPLSDDSDRVNKPPVSAGGVPSCPKEITEFLNNNKHIEFTGRVNLAEGNSGEKWIEYFAHDKDGNLGFYRAKCGKILTKTNLPSASDEYDEAADEVEADSPRKIPEVESKSKGAPDTNKRTQHTRAHLPLSHLLSSLSLR